jgi:two-component sensor histidine kinase
MIRRWLRWLLIGLAFWLAVGLADSLWYYLMHASRGAPPPWASVLRMNIPYWILAAFLTPPVVMVARHAPFDRTRRARTILSHLFGIICFTLIHVVAFQLYTMQTGKGGLPPGIGLLVLIPKMVASSFDRELMLYIIIAGSVYGFDYYERFRERSRATVRLELEQARLRASLSEAKLEALQMQLQPHFLFNALHAISTLVMKGETRTANQMLAHLSDLLRMTLDRSSGHTVPLTEELDLLDAYLRIQKARFGERLRIETEIDPRSLTVQVPPMILQPLVENAIHHGIGASPEAGGIWISTRVRNDRLILTVQNDGVALTHSDARREGVGLSNIRARLEQLYPRLHAFVLEPRAPRGTRAEISLPCEVPGAHSAGEEDATIASAQDGSGPNVDRR